MENREILPYLEINVVVFPYKFHKGSFQLHHKSFTVLWMKTAVREPRPLLPGSGALLPVQPGGPLGFHHVSMSPPLFWASSRKRGCAASLTWGSVPFTNAGMSALE